MLVSVPSHIYLTSQVFPGRVIMLVSLPSHTYLTHVSSYLVRLPSHIYRTSQVSS